MTPFGALLPLSLMCRPLAPALHPKNLCGRWRGTSPSHPYAPLSPLDSPAG